ncbi:MAG: fibronectin type III domain-containing protein, partial [Lachnospiraceae bacterium]|nr:fibronectin type III domain-containing protein [Lachnospiraceae bacterium]
RTKAVFDTQEALDKFIFVNNITTNPDGQAGMRRTNRYAFDLNRDAVFSTMPETIALMKDIMKWDPLIENEWHGYVQNMLIEPCTAPHDPAFDYDLLANNMRNLTYAAGYAVTANTGYDNFLIPWDHYDGGDWDDGGTIYSPMFAELLGTFGYTIEFPHANSDSFDAGLVIDYAMVNEALHGTTDVYEGNRLNGALKDVDGNMRDSHSVDVIDKSMRKNTILAKLETKKRGIENVDSMASDKYFIDKKNGEDVVVGRARPKDADGNTLSFFPDYIVIPYGDLQYNFAEGIKAINQMIDWGIKVEITTEDVEYDGDTIEAGSYLLDMRQANRNVIFEVMSKGYDATGFASMYADIYCNLPDVRGFDSIQIYGKGLFDGKTEVMDSKIQKKADISGVADEYVCFKSQSTDAVRFVNLLLSGKSSGGSTAAKGDVWMLKADVEDVGSASDYIIRTKDLGKLKKLKDAPVIGLNGCEIEGHYISELPEEAVQLVEPIIQWNSTRTTMTGGPLWYLLDDYLGFASLAPDQYNGSTQLREGANVIIANNVNQNNFQNSWAEAVKNGAGVIFIRNAAGLGKLGVKAPTSTNTFSDVAINGTYNVDDSLYTANYADTSTYYARGYAYTNLPERSKILFQSEENGEDAFIGGFQNTKGLKDVFGNKVTIFSTILDGEDFAKPVNAVVFGQYMDYRSHYQKLLPMLATAIYAGAAGIVDDAEAPEIGEIVKDGKNFTVTAEEAASGIGLASLEVYRVKGDKDILIAESDEAELTFTTEVEEDTTLKVVASDKLGNTAECTFVYDGEGGFIDQETAEEEAEAADQEAADEAEAAIDALPDADKITADDEKAVEAARAAYEALTPAQKEKVSPEAVAALEAAEKAVADAKAADAADKEAADKAAAAIAALPAADAITAADEEAVAAARAAYDALTPAQKAKVSPDAVAALEAAEKAVADAKGKDGAADAKVTGLKVKSKARKFTVSWKAAEGVTGYQVQFKLKSAKKWKNLKAATTKTSVKSKKLKKGKKYQFRVRPYTEVNGEKVYGKWATKAKKCS